MKSSRERNPGPPPTVIVIRENGSYTIRVCENGAETCAKFYVELDAMAFANSERSRLGLPVLPTLDPKALERLM